MNKLNKFSYECINMKQIALIRKINRMKYEQFKNYKGTIFYELHKTNFHY